MWGERRQFSRARAAGAGLVILFMVFLGGLTSVSARGPLPMPSPWPSGSTPPIVHPSGDCGHRCLPSVSLVPTPEKQTIPPTDTVR